MPYRTFVDSLGTEWQVWDIVPQMSERRSDLAPERRLRKIEIRFADRRGEQRRLADIRRSALRGSYARGWLCFENGREKRRLSPIPGDWTTCSDERLEGYARMGERVAGTGRTLDFNAEPPMAEAG